MFNKYKIKKKHRILILALGLLFGGLLTSQTFFEEERVEVEAITITEYKSFSLHPLDEALESHIEKYLEAKQEYEWYAGVQAKIEADEAAAKAAAAAEAKAAAAPKSSSSDSGSAQYGSGACGGHLPPCSVMRCESGGNIRAVNPSGIRPAGKWQIITSTWGGYKGYATADQAPEHIQDERAAQIYAGGSGRSQWSC